MQQLGGLNVCQTLEGYVGRVICDALRRWFTFISKASERFDVHCAIGKRVSSSQDHKDTAGIGTNIRHRFP